MLIHRLQLHNNHYWSPLHHDQQPKEQQPQPLPPRNSGNQQQVIPTQPVRQQEPSL